MRRRVEKCFSSGGFVLVVVGFEGGGDGIGSGASLGAVFTALCSSSNVHAPPTGCCRSINAPSPSDWKSGLFLTKRRAKSHFLFLPGGCSPDMYGQMKRGHSVVQVERKAGRDVDAVGPIRES